LRSNFTSSGLVRMLDEWTPVDAPASGMDIAERLGLWLSAFDAIGLQAAHQSIRAIAAEGEAPERPARAARAPDLEDDVRRTRGALASAIARAIVTHPEEGYAPYQQLQRQMEQMVSSLREHLRQTASRLGPRLRQLAVLDAAFGQALAMREQKLVPATVGLLERRFEAMRRAAAAPMPGDADGSTPEPADPGADLATPEAWRPAFEQEWRQALLAELDLRLEPAWGLAEAVAQELKNTTNRS